MNILSLLSGVLFTVFVLLGFHIFFLDKKSITHLLFLIICLILAFVEFDAFFVFSASTKTEFVIWYRMAMIPYYFFFPLLFHFSMSITGYIKKIKLWIVLFYLPALPLAVNTILGDLIIFKDFFGKENVWLFIPAYESPWLIFYMILSLLNYILSIVIIIVWGMKSKSLRIKKQSALLALSLLTVTAFGFTDGVILPLLVQYNSPGLGPLWFSFWVIGVWISLVKYRFLSKTTEIVSHYITANTGESFILLDTDCNIVKVNANTEKLLQIKASDVNEKDFSVIFMNPEKIKTEISNMLSEKYGDLSCRLKYKKADNSTVLLDTKFSIVKDKYNDVIGILVLGKEVKGFKQLKLLYKLTSRELEIIQHIINGCTNKEIAFNLGITERTVKAHIGNMHNKMNIDNKSQLFSLLRNYNIISGYESEKTMIV